MQEKKKKGGVAVILFALIKMSGIGITEASGKLGGTVFSRGRGGTYVRTRVMPSNPQTVAQQSARAIFGAISSAWRTLTEQQRDEWNAITADYPTKNRLGETKILSGKALFQKLNTNLMQANQSLKLDPTAPQGVNGPVEVDVQSIAYDSGDFTAAILVDLATGGDNTTQVIFEATPPLSPGVKNANSKFVRVFRTTASGSQANVSTDFANAYADVFGEPPLGSQIQVRVFTVNPETGEKSSVVKGSAIVEDVS